MLSLHEAAQLRVRGEDILDEALDFTYNHLTKSLNTQLSPSLAARVKHSLRQPLYKGMSRLEARYYISFYEEDPSHNDVILAFAKLDFNILQKLHQEEVSYRQVSSLRIIYMCSQYFSITFEQRRNSA